QLLRVSDFGGFRGHPSCLGAGEPFEVDLSDDRALAVLVRFLGGRHRQRQSGYRQEPTDAGRNGSNRLPHVSSTFQQMRFCLTFISTAASSRKRRSSSFFGLLLSIQRTARSCHLLASSLLPSCQWAMARTNALKPRCLPPDNWSALSRVLIASSQRPAR